MKEFVIVVFFLSLIFLLLGQCPAAYRFSGTVTTSSGVITICMNYPPNNCPVNCQSCTGFSFSACLACPATTTRISSSVSVSDVMQMKTQSCGCINTFIEQVPMQIDCIPSPIILQQDAGCSNPCGSCSGKQCLTCVNSFMNNANCDCQDGFYQDPTKKQCLQCNQRCATCSSVNVCTSCISSNKRWLQGSDCVCMGGYSEYPIIYPSCMTTCMSPPNTCIPGTNVCIGCAAASMQIVNNQCVCYPGNYMGPLKLMCWPCHYSCATCSNPTTCDTCNPKSYRKLNGLCVCQSPTVDVVPQQQCVLCHYSCATCISSTYCLTCPIGTNRIPIGYCVCIPNTYGEDYTSNVCQPCHYSCYLCTGYYDQCQYCSNPTRVIDSNKKCPCKPKFYDTGVALCSPCQFTCLTCQGPNSTDCLTCDANSNRILSNGQCVCKPGFGLVDDFTEKCQPCNSKCKLCSYINVCTACSYTQVFRYLDDIKCSCMQGYYDEGVVPCKPCDKTCMTCTGPQNNQCTDCNPAMNRVLASDNLRCICMPGYYDNYGICILCYYACKYCDSELMSHCTLCPASRYPVRAQPTDNFFSCQCIDPLAIDDGASLECQGCYYSCATCSGPNSNNCLTCAQHSDAGTISREFVNSACVCPLYWFDDGSGELCKQCDYTCETCFDNTNEGCITCSMVNNRQQFGNSCQCIDGYYEDLLNMKCSLCDYSCKTCVDDAKNCVTCSDESLRTLQTDATTLIGSCICPVGYNDVLGVSICQQCHYSCKNCTSDTPNSCSACFDDRLLTTLSDGTYCKCLPHFFDSGSDECSPCSDLCWECETSDTNCTSCSASDFRQLTASNTCTCGIRMGPQYLSYYEVNSECVACPYSCYKCTDSLGCSECSLLDNRQLNGTGCECLYGYIDFGNGKCEQCNYTCYGCQNTATYCLACPVGSLRIFSNNLCQCQQGYFDDGTPICQQCSITCNTCSGVSTFCLTCNSSRYLQNNQCLCLDGFYEDGANCQKCHYSCSTCTGPLLSDCNICPIYLQTQRIYQSGQCICTDGFYDDQLNQKCKQCQAVCLTCSNQNSCDICKAGLNRIFNNGQCECMPKYFESQSLCNLCSTNCLTCSSLNVCTSCDSTLNRQLSLSKCECKQGYYDDGINCLQCPYQCQTCNQQGCLTCNATNFRIKNGNLCDCMDGTYEDGIQQCAICHQTCQTCSNSSQCLSCSSIQFRQLSGSQCVCIQGYFETSTSQCSLCNQSCLTCQTTNTNCSSCDSTLFRRLSNNQCVCIDGKFDNSGICQNCSISCLTCSTSASNCLSCNTQTRYLSNNQCLCNNGFFEVGLQLCQQCNYTCSTCSGSSTSCISCNTNGFRILKSNQCKCQDGYYDNGSQVCVRCQNNCETCSSNSSCDTCLSSRILVSGQCVCQSGFYDDGTPICKQCHPSCQTCTSLNQCTSCNISVTFRRDQSTNYYQCPCNSGFYDDGTQICKKCSYKCVNCQSDKNNCTVCNTNPGTYRLNQIPNCLCQNGYFDDGIQIVCQKCHQRCQTCANSSSNCLICNQSSLRQTSPGCQCIDGYYEDSNFQCQLCQVKCQTCVNGSSCKTCKPDRSGISCLCPSGYYEANLQLCQVCDHKCETCENNSLNCTSCKGNRQNPPNCVCKDHYYDNLTDDCQICNQNCNRCDLNGCLDCAANRILSGVNCNCPLNSIQYSSTPWCSNCQAAVVNSIFSDDLNTIVVNFEYQLQYNFKTLVQVDEYCSQIFDINTTQTLGQMPICNITNQQLIIYLGNGASINVNDELIFISESLKHTDCTDSIQNFILTNVKSPLNLLTPNITLQYPTQPISPCSDQIIQIQDQQINAQRDLNILWSSDTDSVSQLLNQANQFQSTTLIIPQFTLQELSQVALYVKITNILGQQNLYNFTLQTLSSGAPQINFNNYQKQFYRRYPIKLNIGFQNYMCSSQQLIAKNNQITINLLLEEQQLQQNVTTLSNGNIYLIIPAATLKVQSYIAKATIVDDKGQSSEAYYQFTVLPTPIQAEFQGGTQIVDYKKPIQVRIIALDVDQNTNQGIEYSVECIELAKRLPCQDIYNKVVQINKTQPIQYIQGSLFNPFTIIQFNANCTKGSLKTQISGIYIFLESDYPVMNVNYSSSYQSRQINIGEELKFVVINDPVEILYSVGLIYNYDTVAIRSFPNNQITFSIWDMFTQFGNSNQIAIRIQAHDIRYFLPQSKAINIKVNLPPIQSNVQISPLIGDSLFTKFKVQVSNAKHINVPILYRFAYYQSYELYQQDLINREYNNLIVIQDFSPSQSLSFLLESGNITFITSVQDSQGSAANYTQQIIVNSFTQQLNQSQISCEQFITDMPLITSEQLIIAGIELIKMTNTSCQTQIVKKLQSIQKQIMVKIKTEQSTTVRRLQQALSQIIDNSGYSQTRFIQEQSSGMCYNKSQNTIQYLNNNIADNTNESEELTDTVNSLSEQIIESIKQQTLLLEIQNQLQDVGDSQNSWNLKYNLQQRISLFKIISQYYKDSSSSKYSIYNLTQQLQQSFKNDLYLDGPRIQIRTQYINSTIVYMSQNNYKKYFIPDSDIQDYDDSISVNRIISILKFYENPFQYTQDNMDYGQSNNSTIIQIQSPVIIPTLYAELQSLSNQIMYLKYHHFNIDIMKIDNCESQQYQNNYSFVCYQFSENKWQYMGCQVNTYEKDKNATWIQCQCKHLLPTTLFLKQVNSQSNNSNNTSINNSEDEIIYQQVLQQNYLQYVFAGIIFILFLLQTMTIKTQKLLVEDIKTDLDLTLGQLDWITMKQSLNFSKEVFIINFKNLHEITRLYTVKYNEINNIQRTLLVCQNISYIAIISHMISFLKLEINICILITIFGQLILQIITKIIEGFHTGPRVLRLFGYMISIAISLGVLSVIVMFNNDKHQNNNLFVFVVSIIFIYIIVEPIIQFIRLYSFYFIYLELKLDQMNPLLHLVYYFLLDEFIVSLVQYKKQQRE